MVSWPPAVVVPVAAPAIVDLVELGVTAVEGAAVEGAAVAVPEASDVGELAVPCVVGLAVLIGLFPGDRIRPDDSTPKDILDGATALLTARGMNSYGWANAWRSLCWARLKNAEKAYQLVVNNLKPSVGGSNGSASNLFDIMDMGQGRGIFQIEANFGTPSAIIEMLVYSRPGHVELLPALSAAWAASGSVSGVGVRGGFVADISWKNGKVTQATLKSVGGRATTVFANGSPRQVSVMPGQSVTLRNL
ncbi:MAG: hypothetical protein QOI83_2259 [Streptomycetaceae bacterium]|nr:hypothetical protein [Streptomycetaceae bacterium]